MALPKRLTAISQTTYMNQIIAHAIQSHNEVSIPHQEQGRSKIKLINYYYNVWMAEQTVPQSDFMKASCVSDRNQWSGYDETTSFVIPEHT